MADNDIILRIKTLMDTGDVSGAVKELQGAFGKLNLTSDIRSDFDKVFKDLIKSAERFESRAKGTFETVADVNALKKSRKEFDSLFNGMLKNLKSLSTQDVEDIFEFDLTGIKKMNEQLEAFEKKAKATAASAMDIQKVEKVLKELKNMTSKTEGFDILEDLKTGNMESAIAKFEKLQSYLKNFAKGSDIAKSQVGDFLEALNSGDINTVNTKLEELLKNITRIGKGDTGNLVFFADGLKDIAEEMLKANSATKDLDEEIRKIKEDNIRDLAEQAARSAKSFELVDNAAKEFGSHLKTVGDNAETAAQDMRSFNSEIDDVKQRAVNFLSLENSIDLFKQGVRKAIETVKELDKAMAETAVVTDFSIGDMWDKLPEYTQMANELGVATQGVYEASTLYYQQGLQTEEVMALTAETLKMARIAGLECADATNLMTAALRGFNMEINETSAQRITDVYSELAAITAADTNEIATAMTKTASIANSANMELETTAALLAQMIETTREPAETAGTAMKTIIARFTEMKEATSDIISVDGEEVSVNKVDAALASVGVSLKNAKGEFRNLDDVLLELASKWNSLDIMSQRYIATTAAGSRQQSRFIAMMQDYDRTMQLVDAAYNSAGSSSKQFEKTQESLESKLARLENAWNIFLMGIADDQIIRSFIDALTKLIEGFNKVTEGADGVGGSILRLVTIFGGLRVAKAGVEGVAKQLFKMRKDVEKDILKDFSNSELEIEGPTIAPQKANSSLIKSLTKGIADFKSGKMGNKLGKSNDKLKGKFKTLRGDLGNLTKTLGKDGGKWSTGFKEVLKALLPILKVLAPIAVVLGIIAATAAIIYNLSFLKKAKNEAESAAIAVDGYNASLERNLEETQALDSILQELENRESTFENLTVGTVEWYDAVLSTNEALMEQIELLKELGYDINYTYDEKGMIQIEDEEQLQSAQKELLQKNLELQKKKAAAQNRKEIADYKYEAIKSNSQKEWDAFWDVERPEINARDVVKEVSFIGAYAELDSDQKAKIDTMSKNAVASEISAWDTDEKTKLAANKTLSYIEDSHEIFTSEGTIAQTYGTDFSTRGIGDAELYYKGEEISSKEIGAVLTAMGVTYEEAAERMGLQYDAEGFYKRTEENKKVYIDFGTHGWVDDKESWDILMANPDKGGVGDGKDVDAGFFLYQVANAGLGTESTEEFQKFMQMRKEELLYGTEDWLDKTYKKVDKEGNVVDINSPIVKAAIDASNQANQQKRDIYDSLLKTTVNDKKLFEEDLKKLYTDEATRINYYEPYSDEMLKNFASNIQRLSVDVNEITAFGYQTFITSKAAELEEINIETLGELEEEYYRIFNNINLEDSIGSLAYLEQEIERGSEAAKEVKEDFTTRGNAFDLSNQFTDIVESGILDEISEDIAKLSDEAGNIDVSATRELIDSNITLKRVMDDFNVSGYAMGKILTDIQKGELTLTDITAGLVEQYKLLYSAMGQAEDVLYDLRNADLGEDYTEIGRTYEERYNTIKDLYDRGAYGSESFAGNIKSLIGEEEWEKYLNEAEGSTKEAWEKVLADYDLDLNDGNLYGSFSSLIAANENDIFKNENGIITYDLSGFENYDAVLDHMVEAFGISREYAKAMLADMATYSETLQNDLNNLNAAANANNVYNQMYHEVEKEATNDSEEVVQAFTNLTNTQLAATFGKTQEWADAENKAKKEIGENWDTKTLQEQTDAVANEFKKAQKIINQVTVKEKNEEGIDIDVKYNIESIDSDGNKYYRDKNGKMQVQDTFNVGAPGSRGRMGREISDEEYTKRLSKDEEVIKKAVELDDEEFQAWLDSYTGEENTHQIMLEAGFSQDSLKGVEMMKNEMIAKIQGIADALKTMTIKIPIEVPMGLIDASLTGDAALAPSKDFYITIGGENTVATPTGGESGKAAVKKAIEDYEKFTALQNDKTGSGYPYGSDPTNGKSSGGGDSEEYDPVNPKEYNAKQGLEGLEYDRYINSREEELIGKLPEEIQGPLKLANLGEKMVYEAQEIGYNQQLADIYRNDMAQFEDQAKYGQYYAYNDDIMSYQYSDQFMAEYESMSLEKRKAIDEEIAAANEVATKYREVAQELEGGKIQKAFRDVSKASSDFGKELKKTEKATDAFEKTIDGLDIDDRLKDPLKKLGSRFTDVIDETGVLEKKFDGLGIVSEDTIDKLGELGLNEDLQNFVTSTLGGGKGNSVGGALGSLMGGMGDMGGMLSGMMNFDMMSMGLDGLNMGMDMFNQMKDMASQMIQYVVQFITTVINWWINREDWLYNLLSAIEQEVHNFNRQEQVEERFRLYSDEGLNDLVSAWEAMRESLEKQIDLNEQLIKSRQAELQFLNLTNLPFSPAFYYDYTEERVIENPWVYDIYVLLLDLGAMLPEIGQVFSSIKQLMEDNKKRMEDAVKEIEDAREEILELEKKQLELRTKYMEDEIELEELVMDSIIEKQQEEIDELSAMNDAISAGNEKLIETLNNNLERIRQQRENEKTEEELGEKERRLAYLRQDTSNANRAQIMDLKEELEDERRSYTDELIDQKISALEEQNELAAEQRQKQIELLQGQLDYTEKYGLQWAEAQTLIKNGFDSEGRLRVGSELFDMLMSKEDFTSMGNGSTRQVQQIMDWNVTSIAAAAFREINDIWEEGFGNFKMSNDVHDQSRLHLWDDREVDYYELPSWLSFLQPAVNTIQDYLWRTGNNIETFIDTSFLSGKNSSSILGKTIVPLLQELVGLVKGSIAERNKTSEADGVVQITDPGYIGENAQSIGYSWIERFTNSIGDSLVTMGDNIVSAFTKNNKSNTQTTQKVTETNIDNHPNFYITIDGGDPDSLVEVIQDSAYNGNYANVVGEY